MDLRTQTVVTVVVEEVAATVVTVVLRLVVMLEMAEVEDLQKQFVYLSTQI
jgi:hypothetical protein